MFSRSKRLSRAEITNTLREGARYHSVHFSLIIPKKGDGYSVIVSKKTAKKAIERNRMKRISRELIQKSHTPKSLIMFPKKDILTTPFAELARELQELLSKITINQ